MEVLVVDCVLVRVILVVARSDVALLLILRSRAEVVVLHHFYCRLIDFGILYSLINGPGLPIWVLRTKYLAIIAMCLSSLMI